MLGLSTVTLLALIAALEDSAVKLPPISALRLPVIFALALPLTLAVKSPPTPAEGTNMSKITYI
jgi:hypothetical protein